MGSVEPASAVRRDPEAGTARRVPFNRPFLVGTEVAYVGEAADAMHVSGDGLFTKRCQAALEAITGARKALLTTSGTDALEMAALLLDIQPGDEVIVPSFTFPSTANAWVLRGATPVFVDIRPDTLNMDERQIEALMTPRTRVIVPVHYAGIGCEMDTILDIARRRDVVVVEDNAHGLFGRYRGRSLGGFGALAALSFHETKNLSCGEGGALLLNNPELVERAEIIREKGTNRAAFFRGQVDKYTWVDVGSSYLPSDILAAFLWAQIEAAESIQQRRGDIWRRYAEALASWAATEGVRLPQVPSHCEQPGHLFYLLMPSAADRDHMIEHLRQRGVSGVFHYLPLHRSPMARRWPTRGACAVSEQVSACLVRLPFFTALDAASQAVVIEAVQEYRVRPRASVSSSAGSASD
jgi:dTDP-4-amino-4,6-dideoxygalactose transaminase